VSTERLSSADVRFEQTDMIVNILRLCDMFLSTYQCCVECNCLWVFCSWSQNCCCRIELLHRLSSNTPIQQLWRQVFCSCRSKAVEQPSSWSATSWH